MQTYIYTYGLIRTQYMCIHMYIDICTDLYIMFVYMYTEYNDYIYIYINMQFIYLYNLYIDTYNPLAGSHGLGDTPCHKFSKVSTLGYLLYKIH
jgi:hypothetical protein